MLSLQARWNKACLGSSLLKEVKTFFYLSFWARRRYESWESVQLFYPSKSLWIIYADFYCLWLQQPCVVGFIPTVPVLFPFARRNDSGSKNLQGKMIKLIGINNLQMIIKLKMFDANSTSALYKPTNFIPIVAIAIGGTIILALLMNFFVNRIFVQPFEKLKD